MHSNIQKIAPKIFALIALVSLVGCGTPTFTKTATVNPDTGFTNYTVSISPGVSNALAGVRDTINSVPTTGVPYADLAKDAALGVLGLVGSVLGFVARVKTKQANQQIQAADILAGHVVNAGLQQKALADAANTPAFPALATHIDNNTITK